MTMHDEDAIDDLPRVRQMVGAICKDLLEAAGGKIDAVVGYCRLAPATIVRDYFGLIGIPRKDLMEWSY